MAAYKQLWHCSIKRLYIGLWNYWIWGAVYMENSKTYHLGYITIIWG